MIVQVAVLQRVRFPLPIYFYLDAHLPRQRLTSFHGLPSDTAQFLFESPIARFVVVRSVSVHERPFEGRRVNRRFYLNHEYKSLRIVAVPGRIAG